MFVKFTPTSFTNLLLVYVDNIVLVRNDMTEIDYVKQILYAKFKIKDLVFLKYFLGLEMPSLSLEFI